METRLSDACLVRSGEIKRYRVLPAPVDILVHKGDVVEPEQPVAERLRPGEMFTVDVARALGVSARRARRCMLVSEGKRVVAGDPLARKDGPFRHREVSAPVTGIVSAIVGGRLFFKTEDYLERLTAGLPGRVVDVITDRGVVIACEGSVISGIWGLGADVRGTLTVAGYSSRGRLTWEEVGRKSGGTIVAGDSLTDERALRRARQFGLSGLLTSSIDPKLVPLAMELGLSIIVTEGMGDISLPDPVRELLMAHVGRPALLFPLGADEQHRPELIIPLEDSSAVGEPGIGQNENAHGPLVRITRPPYCGVVGRLISLLPETVGTSQVAEVRLPDGGRAQVPIVNLELLRE